MLAVSKDENDSNEVAITCDLGADNPLEVYGVSLGTEHEVDVRADTLSNHILVSQKSVAVVILPPFLTNIFNTGYTAFY